MTATPSTILYVDDDADDQLLLSESLQDQQAPAHLICASDGEEAVAYLNALDQSALPSLIILDLNMPRWDGKRTLSYIKSHPVLSGIPVIILSTSGNKADQESCYRLGAISYLEKPYDYREYRKIINYFIPLLKT
jgi:CheY-like chemotaxis protein